MTLDRFKVERTSLGEQRIVFVGADHTELELTSPFMLGILSSIADWNCMPDTYRSRCGVEVCEYGASIRSTV